MYARTRRFTAAHVLSQLLLFFLPLFLIALTVQPLRAQTDVLREGVRVRVTTHSTTKLVGVVKSLSADSVHLYTEESGATMALARQDITALRVSQGRTSGQGAKRGALWGVAVGAVVVAITSPVVLLAEETNTDEVSLGVFAFQMLGSGALWGAGIGALVRAEKWEAIPLRPRIQSSSSGVGLGFTVKPAFLH